METVNPNSLAAVMKEMRDAALANNTIKPSIDEIEAEYQWTLALSYAAGLHLHHSQLGLHHPPSLMH